MSTTVDRGWIATTRLVHFGVKGMKWGVRRDSRVTLSTGGLRDKKVKAKGGYNRPTSADAARAARIGQIRRKSGARALSDADLTAYNNRLNLEANAQRLNYQQSNAGKKFVLSILGQSGKNATQQVANQAASIAVKRALARAGIAALAV